MAYLVRLVHVGSAAYLLGGTLLLILIFLLSRSQRSEEAVWQISVMQAYELGFWVAVGLIVATGVGNLGHFGEALPGPDTEWGGKLLLKLSLAGTLLVLSAIRSVAVHIVGSGSATLQTANLRSLQVLYYGTAVLATGTVGLAVALAHF